MAERPSAKWRQQIEAEAGEIAAGILDADEAFAAALFPESLLAETDAALAAFEAELRWLTPPPDEELFRVVERVVLDLNRINAAHGGGAYETGEREQLCYYIDAALGEGGVDVEALASRRGIERWEITDEWRR